MSVHKKVFTIESRCLRQTVMVGVVAPDKIDKILILFHGYDGTFAELDENLPLLEYAEDNKVLIVTPNLDNGYYIDRDLYRISDFVMKEMFNMLFVMYNLQITPDLYIAGISMGGYGSLLIGFQYPRSFKKIISISGAFIAKDVAIGNPEIVGLPGDAKVLEYFTKTFAPFETLEESIMRNPVASVKWANENFALPEIIIVCGTKDPLFGRNLDLIQRFGEYNVEFDWYPIDGGAHDYRCFDEGLRYALKMMK